MPTHQVARGTRDGQPVVVLAGGDLRAEVAPGAGMVVASLTHRGEEVLGQRGGLARYVETGSSMGIPFLHPWANRLGEPRYAFDGREVTLDPAACPLRLDPNGLPIHGLLTASPYWEPTGEETGEGAARVRARLDFGAHEELLAGFPFPHVIEVEVELSGRTLSVETALRATGDVPVPVAFGYHPYVRLPGLPRAEWRVTLPLRRRARLDDRGIPTGEVEAFARPPRPLGETTFDDLFVELCHPPEFVLEGGGRRLEVRFEQGYPVAQVYAPEGEDFVCFEPMTAPTNALVSGDGLRSVAPGQAYLARFSVCVRPAAG